MKAKSLSLALLVSAGVLSSTDTASAYTIYGNTDVNGVTYNLSPGANLSHADLHDTGFLYIDLSHANLSDANLSDAFMPGANLSYANLSNAYMYYAQVFSTGADLSYANLSNAYMAHAYLYDANLSYAILTNADLTYADLTGATVSYSNWADFSTNSGALGLGSYSYDTSLINYAGSTPVPESSTYGLIGIGALGVAFAARRRKLKTA
jgi:uncharacterized protein YjbI with pentapeptide repeats